jgi:predicted RNase H-like HicB family nuclease
MSGYVVIIERAKGNYSAYMPDLPGCVATGKSRTTTERRIRRAIALHLEGMRADGNVPPRPSARAVYVPGRRLAG